MPPLLPVVSTSLVGRSAELAWVVELLLRQRFVTLFGPGGMGKTRLALAVAEQLQAQFADGVFWLALDTVREADMVLPRLAQVLDLPPVPPAQLLPSLQEHLQARYLLLILDCFEHVVAAAPNLGQLVAVGPRLHVLVTSRVVLNVRGEQLYEVPPLAYPTAEATWSAISQAAAVQLFVQRVQQVLPSFAITPENSPRVRRLCQQLEGWPLALELVAAQLRTRPLEALALDLDARFERAVATPGVARPETLRTLIDWSYSSLAPATQNLFRQLAVFAGGWTVEAAQAVCAAVANQAVLPELLQLADHALVMAQPQEDEVRYRFLDPLRLYAAELLETTEVGPVLRRAHAAYFLQWVETLEPELIGPHQAQWFNRLEVELANLRVALTWMLTHAPQWALRLTGSLRRFLGVRGYSVEGQYWVEAALAATPADELTPPRAQAHLCAGMMAYAQRDHERARHHYTLSLQGFRVVDDRRNIAILLNSLGLTEYGQRHYAAAHAWFSESLALFRALQDTWGIPMPLINLGLIANIEGDHLTAEAHFTESLTLNRAAQDPYGIAYSLDCLGGTLLFLDEAERALPLFAESLTLRRELKHQWGITLALDNLGAVALMLQQPTEAQHYYEESLDLRRALDHPWGMAASWSNLGDCYSAQRQHLAAQAAYLNSLALFVRHQDLWLVGRTLTGLSALLAQAAPQPLATVMADLILQLCAAGETLRRQSQVSQWPWAKRQHQAVLAAAQAALNPEAYNYAWETGTKLTHTVAINLAYYLPVLT